MQPRRWGASPPSACLVGAEHTLLWCGGCSTACWVPACRVLAGRVPACWVLAGRVLVG
jgi:hypothetical protein